MDMYRLSRLVARENLSRRGDSHEMRWHTLRMLKGGMHLIVWCGGLVGMQDWEGGVEVITVKEDET